jgi:hypothetical protein
MTHKHSQTRPRYQAFLSSSKHHILSQFWLNYLELNAISFELRPISMNWAHRPPAAVEQQRPRIRQLTDSLVQQLEIIKFSLSYLISISGTWRPVSKARMLKVDRLLIKKKSRFSRDQVDSYIVSRSLNICFCWCMLIKFSRTKFSRLMAMILGSIIPFRGLDHHVLFSILSLQIPPIPKCCYTN